MHINDIFTIPDINHPFWIYFIKNVRNYHFHTLPTQIVMMQVYLLAKDGTASKIKEAKQIVFTFFCKNKYLVFKDIKLLRQVYNEEFEKTVGSAFESESNLSHPL